MNNEKRYLIRLLLGMLGVIFIAIGPPIILHLVMPWAIGTGEMKGMLATGVFLLCLFALPWSVVFFSLVSRMRSKKS